MISNELIINFESISKNNKAKLKITYGINETPLGKAMIAKSEKGICAFLFITASEEEPINKLFKKWSHAEFELENQETQKIADQIFNHKEEKPKLTLYLRGTDFQLKVWKALLKIPKGHTLSYKDIANIINEPHSVRAVANAIGQNPITYLVPCHRVLRSDGELGGYSGGIDRKKILLDLESTNNN